jgi:hypothetical protein
MDGGPFSAGGGGAGGAGGEAGSLSNSILNPAGKN